MDRFTYNYCTGVFTLCLQSFEHLGSQLDGMNKIGQDEDVARRRASLAATMASYLQRYNVRHENMLFLLAESKRELELCLTLSYCQQLVQHIDVIRFASRLPCCHVALLSARVSL